MLRIPTPPSPGTLLQDVVVPLTPHDVAAGGAGDSGG